MLGRPAAIMRFDSQRHHIQSLGDSVVHPQSDIAASTPSNEIKTSALKGDRSRQFARKIFCICERPRTARNHRRIFRSANSDFEETLAKKTMLQGSSMIYDSRRCFKGGTSHLRAGAANRPLRLCTACGRWSVTLGDVLGGRSSPLWL